MLGGDLNCYGIARAFSEAFGVKSYAFGRYPLGATSHSGIVDFSVVEGLSDDKTAIDALCAFADGRTENDELYLFGCTDEYAEMIIRNRDVLSKRFFCPCTDMSAASKLATKESFYGMCEKYAIPHPKTYIFRPESKNDELSENTLGFSYPVIIKPSHSSLYWKHPFSGMKKLYSAKDKTEAENISRAIFGSGYDKSLIIQDTIPGDDTEMYVLTCYSGTDGKVKTMCMGHVLLEEHTPKGLGNHTAIITENHPEISEPLRHFLDDIGYVGFSNFDIKFDTRDGIFKVFEINLRQGRSNYYVTGAGQSIAETVVADRHGKLPDETRVCKDEYFWYTVPKPVIYKYVSDKETVQRLKALVRAGKSSSTLFYGRDLANPLRLFYVAVHNMRYFIKYRER